MNITLTHSGVTIRINDNALQHLKAHPEITLDLIMQSFYKIDFRSIKVAVNATIPIVVEFDKNIGVSTIIKTDSLKYKDQSLYAYRKGRSTPSRVVTEFINLPTTNKLTLVLLSDKIQSNKYKLITAWVGEAFEGEIDFVSLDETSKGYWKNHAFVYNDKTKASFESEPFLMTGSEALRLSTNRYIQKYSK